MQYAGSMRVLRHFCLEKRMDAAYLYFKFAKLIKSAVIPAKAGIQEVPHAIETFPGFRLSPE
jgi:hypothetical protein